MTPTSLQPRREGTSAALIGFQVLYRKKILYNLHISFKFIFIYYDVHSSIPGGKRGRFVINRVGQVIGFKGHHPAWQLCVVDQLIFSFLHVKTNQKCSQEQFQPVHTLSSCR